MTRLTPGPPRLFALLPALIAFMATMNLEIPYYALSPGPTRDVVELISVDGAARNRPNGKILLTTVSLRSIRVADALQGWASPVVDVVPRSDIVPKGVSEDEVDKQNVSQMEQSKRWATLAALRFLHYPIDAPLDGMRVDAIDDASRARQILRQGDLIVGVDGRPIEASDDITRRVQRVRPGQPVTLRARRDGRTLDLTVPTIAGPEGKARIGIQVTAVYGEAQLPVKIDIKSMGIGGPSAGLMFALGIVDLLDGRDLIRGAIVAGTGVISLEGTVSPVGGVAQKVAAAERDGARLFLVPSEEVRAASRAARRLKIVGVKTLEDAVRAVEALPEPRVAAGGPSS